MATATDTDATLFCFDDFELDAAAFELRRAGSVVPLQPKVFDVLVHVVRHPGRVVSKRELLDNVWPDEVVSETALTHALMDARRALGDDGTRQRFIRTVRGRGYRFVGGVLTQPGERPPSRGARGGEEPFVGRERELDRLTSLLVAASKGQGRFAMVGGEPGIGKTALVERLAELASQRGLAVFRGRCHEGQGSPPYRPWLEMLRAHLRGSHRDILLDQMGTGAADIARVLPELRAWLGDREPPLPLEEDQERLRLFDSLKHFAHCATRERPALGIVEDLHAADQPSLLLARYLAREIGALPILMVGTYRDLPTRGDQRLANVVADLRTVPTFQAVRLTGLDDRELGELVAHVVGEPPPDSLVAALARQTHGNPFFVRELLRHWHELGVLDLSRPGWVDDSACRAGLPETIRDVMRQRLSRHSPPCRETLRIAAVLGEEFSLRSIESTCGLPTEEVRCALDEALVGGEIREVDGKAGRYEFSHALIRESLYAELPPHRRRELHRWIGKTLEEMYGPEREAHIAELAGHFAEAAPLGEAERALDYTARAAARAADQTAFEEAAALYNRALDLNALCDGSSPEERCELLLALGWAQRNASDRAASRATFESAARLATGLGHPPLLARAALGMTRLFELFDAEKPDTARIALLEESLPALPQSALRARALASLALALYRVDTHRCLTFAEQAVSAARACASSRALAEALYAHYVAQLRPRVRDAPLAQLDTLQASAEEAGMPELVTISLYLRAAEHMARGDIKAADDQIAILGQHARAHRSPRATFIRPGLRAGSALRQGRLDRAETHTREAFELMQRSRPGVARLAWASRIYEIRRHQGRLSELVQPLSELVYSSPDVPGWWESALAVALLESGRERASHAWYEGLVDDYLRRAPRCYSSLGVANRIVELATRFGDRPRAQALFALLEPHADCHAATMFTGLYVGPISAELGRLALALGRPDAALSHFEQALQAMGQMRLKWWRARIQLDCGAALLRRGCPEDRGRAGDLAAEAAAVGRELGLSALVRDAAALGSALP